MGFWGTKCSAQLKAVQILIRNRELGGPLPQRLTRIQMEGLDVTILPYDPAVMSSGVEIS